MSFNQFQWRDHTVKKENNIDTIEEQNQNKLKTKTGITQHKACVCVCVCGRPHHILVNNSENHVDHKKIELREREREKYCSFTRSTRDH